MNNTVIKSLNKKHGAEVIKYWKSLGVITTSYTGIQTEETYGKNSFIYYGVIENDFSNYTLKQVQEANAEIIELPKQINIPEITSGVKMMVSNNNIT